MSLERLPCTHMPKRAVQEALFQLGAFTRLLGRIIDPFGKPAEILRRQEVKFGRWGNTSVMAGFSIFRIFLLLTQASIINTRLIRLHLT